MFFRRLPAGIAGAILFSAVSQAQEPALAPQFIVNATTSGAQWQSAVAMDPSGNFVVVWKGDVPPASSGLFARRFDVEGAPLAGGFQVESSPANPGSYPSVAKDGSGNFVVAWEAEDEDYGGIFARRFDSSGTAQGLQFLVNTTATSYQYSPSVARNASGNFVVVWESYQDGDGYGIYAQRYDAAGAAQGGEFRVNTYTTGDQTYPSVAMSSSGAFVVVWSSAAQDGSGDGVFGQRFDASGTPQGVEFRANVTTASDQLDARVGMDSTGRFAVVWRNVAPGGANSGIRGRRYDAAGAAQGGEILVSLNTSGFAVQPDVTMDAAGNFLAVWSRGDIFGQRFDAQGRRLGSEFQVGSSNPLPTTYPRASGNATGNFVVAWDGNDGAGYGVEARRLERDAAGVMRVDEPSGVVLSPTVAGNRVLEPGETVAVEPAWKNTLSGTVAITGTASDLDGPGAATYTINDNTADYGSLAQGASADCATATGNCYLMTVSNAARPAAHWDASFLETLGNDFEKTWRLHVGESFSDVPTSQTFYRAIESVLHAGITTGCTGTTYCPGNLVTRSEMSLFLARGVAGGGAAIPTSGVIGANAYNCAAGGHSLFTDVLPTDSFCRSVHYLGSQNVTTGCSPTQYCPVPDVTRLEMSTFVARAVVAPGGGAAVPLTYGPDPVTGLSYSCDIASPAIHFTDVPASNSFCKHAHFLWAKGIISGCGDTTYCPNDFVTRDAMAKFLTNGFAVQLYGP